MTDANGVATVLGKNEALTVAQADTKLTLRNAADSADVTSFAPESDVDGEYYVRAKGTTGLVAGSATLTFTGSGLLPATLTTNTSITKVATTAITGTVAIACTTAASCIANSATPDYYVKAAPALTISGLTSATTATIHSVDVQTALGDEYSSTITVAATAAAGTAGAATATFTGPAPALGYPSELTIVASANTLDADFTYQAPVSTTVSVEGAASVLSATAGVNTFVAKVVDQYTSALANVAVSVTVSGRNTVAAKTLGVSDANGLITYSLTDAGTTGTKDTVTFSIASGTTLTAAATITYGTVTVDTVTVSGGSKAETVAGTTLTAINGADNGPETSAVAIKAVVKDASGNLLAGVPVVFTVDKGAIKKTASIDYATVYTGADGSATTYAFNWLSEKQTITATAGGKSSTDYLTWAATDATTARVLSVTATGDIVTVKVVDRFGNGVKGVSVDLSRTGTGLFGNGSSTQTAVTDKNGTSDVRFSGTGTVTAELASTYAQAADVAGKIAATAVTAAVAGTTKGTGASLAPAGVNKVTVAIEESANSTLAAAQSARRSAQKEAQ
jgi:adhesin/invasin